MEICSNSCMRPSFPIKIPKGHSQVRLMYLWAHLSRIHGCQCPGSVKWPLTSDVCFPAAPETLISHSKMTLRPSSCISLSDTMKCKINNLPYHLRRGLQSSSVQAPAPEESRIGRSRSPQSPIFPRNLPPTWCCYWSASTRVLRGERLSADYSVRNSKSTDEPEL